MPGNCPEESKQHSEHGESMKSRIFRPSFISKLIKEVTLWFLYIQWLDFIILTII